LEGKTPKKNVISFFRKNRARAKSEMQGHFSLVLPSEARQWRGGSVLVRMFVKVGSDFNQKVPQRFSNGLCRYLKSVLIGKRDSKGGRKALGELS